MMSAEARPAPAYAVLIPAASAPDAPCKRLNRCSLHPASTFHREGQAALRTLPLIPLPLTNSLLFFC